MRARRSVLPLVIAVLVAAAAPACSDLLGIHDLGPPADGGASGIDAGDGGDASDSGSAEDAAGDAGTNPDAPADVAPAIDAPADGPSSVDATDGPPRQCTPGSVQTCTDATHGILCDATGHWGSTPQACPQPTPDCVTDGSTSGCVCLGYPAAGTCVESKPLASATNQPFHVAVDATSLYWSEYPSSGCDGAPCSDASIKKMALTGGAVTTLASGLPLEPDFRINASGVYWNGQGCPSDGGACAQGLVGVPLSGGSPTLVAPIPLKTFALEATNAYGVAQGAIVRVPLDGSAATTIASGFAPNAIVVDSSFAYWTDQVQASVMKVSLSGGPAFPLATGRSNPGGLVADTTNLYWVEAGCADAGGCTELLSLPFTGTSVAVLGTAATGSTWLVPYASSVYFSDFVHVLTVPIATGPVTVVATPPNGIAQDIAVDATSIYWGDVTGTSIRKIARP